MNITGNTIVKRGIKNGKVGKLTAIQSSNKAHLFEINARRDAGHNQHDRMGLNRDFQLYADTYRSSYGSHKSAYTSGRRHNFCNECNGMGWLIAIVAGVAGFGLSYMTSLGFREEFENDKAILEFQNDWKKGDTFTDANNTYVFQRDVEKGTQVMGNDQYPEFWNWVIAGAGAILSLGLAGLCLHCCAESKNKIEARHGIAGAELAGILTDSGNLPRSGATLKLEDPYAMPLPPNHPSLPMKKGMPIPPKPSMGYPPNESVVIQSMSMPPNRSMGMPPIPPVSMRGGMPMPPTGMQANEPMKGAMNMPPPTYATKTKGIQPSDPGLFIGPLDENTRKFKQGKMVIHRPQVEVREEIVGYDVTEIALKDAPRSNRRHRSNRRRVVEEDSDN